MKLNNKVRWIFCLNCLLVLVLSCVNPTIEDQERKVDERLIEKKSPSSELNDSTKIISSLYEGVEIYKPITEISSFDFEHSYDAINNLITIKSSTKVNGIDISYFIKLMDASKIYDSKNFNPSGDYKYVESYFEMDGKKVDLTNIKISNNDQFTQPGIIWYDSDFGTALKYYNVKGKEIFLINGLNFYCNGRYCTSYQVFVIQREEEKLKASTFYYDGQYPFDFENTFLFDNDKDSTPEIYVTKNVEELSSKADFEMLTIKF